MDEIKLYEDIEPELVTVTFYKGADGHLYNIEGDGKHFAKYDLCTHRACEQCGKPTKKTIYLV